MGYMYDYVDMGSSISGAYIWSIISLILAIGGGITIYCIFLRGNKKFTGFLKKAIDFLNFKSLLIEAILKITYLIFAIYITLQSLTLLTVHVGIFFLTLIVGNGVLRLFYELSMLIIKICKNTSEINEKLDNKKD